MAEIPESQTAQKTSRQKLLSNLRDLCLIAVAFLGFAVVAAVVVPQLPRVLGTIIYTVRIIAVGAFVRSLAKGK